jgi:molybdate transport system ATP-binding protein
MIGGNIPDETRVVSVAIYDHVEALEYAEAHWLAGGMLAVQLRGAAGAVFRRRGQAGGGCGLSCARPTAAIEARFAGRLRRLPPRGRPANCPGAASPRCLVTPARARPPCCAAWPAWSRAAGRVVVNGECWQDDARGIFLPTHRRALGYVFQEASLFAHLSVRRQPGVRPASASPPRHKGAARCMRLNCWALATCWSGARPAVRRRTPARGDCPRAAHQPAPAADGRAPGRPRPRSASRRSCPTWSACTTNWTIPVLYVSHSPDEVARLADHVVMLGEGKVDGRGRVCTPPWRDSTCPPPSPRTPAWWSTARWPSTTTTTTSPGWTSPAARCGCSASPEAAGTPPALSHPRARCQPRRPPLKGTSILNLLPVTVTEIVGADTPAHVLVRPGRWRHRAARPHHPPLTRSLECCPWQIPLGANQSGGVAGVKNRPTFSRNPLQCTPAPCPMKL